MSLRPADAVPESRGATGWEPNRFCASEATRLAALRPACLWAVKLWAVAASVFPLLYVIEWTVLLYGLLLLERLGILAGGSRLLLLMVLLPVLNAVAALLYRRPRGDRRGVAGVRRRARSPKVARWAHGATRLQGPQRHHPLPHVLGVPGGARRAR
ncbi:hypothetical protein [Nocardia inohanensis]|uniref:hypothetical protein n=1 Tax=Nocardia inohanensis TaxID=209246 RepID=UPI0012FCCCEB|nr:hypothetical protein [Nocardia inohanensis]